MAATRVPFLDAGAACRELRREIDAAVARVLESGVYVLGEEVEAFETEFAAYTGASRCVGVGNGLDALRLALRAVGVAPGDEVVVPAHTFIATWLAVSELGARPVPVEPLSDAFTIDAERIEAAVTPRTRAVVPVHLYGQPADLDPVIEVARRRGLAVVEDAAQAHGARHRGRRIGAHGDAVAWSFYPAKNLGALGDGGAVTTSDPAVAERVRLLRNYGSPAKYEHAILGVNSRLDPIQAAVLRVKLRRLDEWNARRRQVAELYLDALAGSDLALPRVPQWAEPSWHLFVVRSRARDALRERLRAAGVETLIHYPTPPHRQGAYRSLGAADLPVTEAICREVLSLPIGPHLGLERAREVVEALEGVPA